MLTNPCAGNTASCRGKIRQGGRSREGAMSWRGWIGLGAPALGKLVDEGSTFSSEGATVTAATAPPVIDQPYSHKRILYNPILQRILRTIDCSTSKARTQPSSLHQLSRKTLYSSFTMSSLVGQDFPEDVAFTYVPYVDGKGVNEMCGMPIKYDATKGKPNKSSPQHRRVDSTSVVTGLYPPFEFKIGYSHKMHVKRARTRRS